MFVIFLIPKDSYLYFLFFFLDCVLKAYKELLQVKIETEYRTFPH